MSGDFIKFTSCIRVGGFGIKHKLREEKSNLFSVSKKEEKKKKPLKSSLSQQSLLSRATSFKNPNHGFHLVNNFLSNTAAFFSSSLAPMTLSPSKTAGPEREQHFPATNRRANCEDFLCYLQNLAAAECENRGCQTERCYLFIFFSHVIV